MKKIQSQDFLPLTPKFLEDPHAFMKGKSQSYRRLLDSFLHFTSKYKGNVFPHMDILAERMGTTVDTAYRLSTVMHNEGLIHKQYRPHNQSCVFRVNPKLLTRSMANILKDFCANASYLLIPFVLSSLLSFAHKELPKRESPSVKREFSYNKYILTKARTLNTYTCKISGGFGKFLSRVGNKDDTEVGKYVKKCEIAMNEPIHGLILTQAGKVELSCFPSTAITYGIETFKKHDNGKVSNPFRYIYSQAERWCVEHGIIPTYRKRDDLRLSLHIPPQMKKMRGEHIIPVVEVKTVNSNPFKTERTNERYTPKQEPTLNTAPYQQWVGHVKEGDGIQLETSKEQVAENIQALNTNPFFALLGIKAEDMFKDEMEQGETVVRSRTLMKRRSNARLCVEEGQARGPTGGQMHHMQPSKRVVP